MKIVLFLIMFVLSGVLARADEPDLGIYMEGLAECFASATDSDARRGCEGRFADICMARWEGGETTYGMSTCAMAEMQAWDDLLNEEYWKAVANAREQDALEQEFSPEFAAFESTLHDAQSAWVSFRDANCGLYYARWGSGSMRNISAAFCRLHMTAERTVELYDLFHYEN